MFGVEKPSKKNDVNKKNIENKNTKSKKIGKNKKIGKKSVTYLGTLNERKYQKYLDFLIKQEKEMNVKDKEERDDRKDKKIIEIITKIINKKNKVHSSYNNLTKEEKKEVEKNFNIKNVTIQRIIKDECTKDFQNELIKEHHIKSFYINRKTAVVLCYDDGCYYDIGERILKNEYIRFIGSNVNDDNLSGVLAKTSEINDFVKTTISVSEIEQEDFVQKDGLINFNNCCYDIEKSKDIVHSYKYNFRYKLPYNFNSKALCPNIDKIINELFKGDNKKEQTLYECISTSLMSGYKNKVIIMGMGPPNTGKTTLLNIISKLLGERNIQHLSMSQLTDDMFSAIELSNKIASLSDELSPFSGKSLSLMKSITGNGVINVRGLHSSYQKLKNEATIWQFGNYEDLILTEKDESSFFRRVVLLLFENEFSKERNNEVIGITDELLDIEFSGMANKVIEGYKRLNKNDDFTCCKKDSYKKCKIIANKDNPSMLTFISSHVYKTIDNGDECKEMYEKYVDFLEDNYFDEEIPTQIAFNKVLKKWFDTKYGKISGVHVWDNLKCN